MCVALTIRANVRHSQIVGETLLGTCRHLMVIMLKATGVLVVTRQLQRGPLVLIVLLQRFRAVVDGVRRAALTTTTLGGVLSERRRYDEHHTFISAEHWYDV